MTALSTASDLVEALSPEAAGVDPRAFAALLVIGGFLAFARLHASARWWSPTAAWFWNPLRLYILTPLDTVVERLPLVGHIAYTKTRVGQDEHVMTFDWTLAHFLEVVEAADGEVQPLSSVAKDYEGDMERASVAFYHGRRLFPGAPGWLRLRQVHVRPFGPDGELRVTGHDEYNPWNPLVMVPHFLGWTLKPAPNEVVAALAKGEAEVSGVDAPDESPVRDTDVV